MKDRCWFADDKGVCKNPDENTQGAACSLCEAFVKLSGQATAERCGQCAYRYDDGYCPKHGQQRQDDDPSCKNFEPFSDAWKNRKLETTKMTQRIRHIETKMIPLESLTKHPDAEAFGADAEDRQAQASSVGDVGLLDPIAVTVADGGEGYMILDGCGRYDALRAAGAEEALCLVVELDGMTPREFAMHKNTMGRKITTGQRLLCYLSIHKAEVLAAADSGSAIARGHVTAGGPGSRDTGGRGNLRSRDHGFYTRDIAERLGVSDKDVRAAVDLLKTADAQQDATEDGEAGQSVQETFDAVMDGRLPVRRWRPAYMGKAKTKGAQRAPINYPALAQRTLASLRTVFDGWQEIGFADREAILSEFAAAVASAPDDVSHLLQKMLAVADGAKARK